MDHFIIGIVIFGVILSAGCTDLAKTSSQPSEVLPKTNQTVIFTDFSGNLIQLSRPAERIVCIDGMESLAAMGAGNKIVGVGDYALQEPYLMKLLPNAVSVGGYNAANAEQIINLHPDIVIAITTYPSTLDEKLKPAGIPVARLDGYIIEKMPDYIRTLGKIIGNTTESQKYINYYQDYFDLVNSRLNAIPESNYPKVYFEGSSPYSTVGKGSGGDSLIRTARGRNIAGDLGSQWPTVSPEWVVQENPDVIIKVAYPDETVNASLSQIREAVMKRPGLSGTNAVKTGQVYIINEKVAYGNQGIITLLYIAKCLYPGQFSDIDPKKELHNYAAMFLPGSDDLDAFYPDLGNNTSVMN